MRIEDLLPQTLDVEVEMVYTQEKDPETGKFKPTTSRKVGVICMRALSRHEWEEIGQEVGDAVPPPDLKTGKPDYDAPDYKLNLIKVEAERDARRLVQAVSIEGGLVFKSKTNEGKAKELRRIDAGIYNALFTQLWMTINSFQRKVTASADSFRGGNTNGRVLDHASAHTEPEAVVT